MATASKDRSAQDRRRRPSGAHLNGDAPRHARRRRRRGVIVGLAVAAAVGYPTFAVLVAALGFHGAERPWVGLVVAGVALASLPVTAGVALGSRRIGRALLHGIWSGVMLCLLIVATLLVLT